eukprot:scaffold14401_cov59-Attheya_sp.AAC.5
MTGGESNHRSTSERALLSSREETWKQDDDSRARREEEEEEEEEESSTSIQQAPQQQQHSSSSPEGAGVVRGLSRSVRTAAQSVAKRSVAGRLPLPSRAAVPRMMRGKLPARQVARVTDRLSTGLDVVSTAMENDNTPKGGATAPPSRALRIASLSWSKNEGHPHSIPNNHTSFQFLASQ